MKWYEIGGGILIHARVDPVKTLYSRSLKNVVIERHYIMHNTTHPRTRGANTNKMYASKTNATECSIHQTF